VRSQIRLNDLNLLLIPQTISPKLTLTFAQGKESVRIVPYWQSSRSEVHDSISDVLIELAHLTPHNEITFAETNPAAVLKSGSDWCPLR